MTLNLKFEADDFENLRAFEKAIKRQLGPNVYVGTNSLCFYFDYPPALSDQLRPSVAKFLKTANLQLEFTLESSLPDAK